MNEISQILLSGLGVILTGLSAWAVTKITSLIDSKIKDSKAKTILNDAVGVVERVVKETQQTYVDSLKNQNIFDKEAQTKALENAKEKIKIQLSKEAIDYINKNYSNFEEWLTTSIEAKLYDLKEKGTKK